MQVPLPVSARRIAMVVHPADPLYAICAVHRSLVSLTKSTSFVVPFALIHDVGLQVGSVNQNTPKDFIKAIVSKSSLAGWLKNNRTWLAEYNWVLTAQFLEVKQVDMSDELLPDSARPREVKSSLQRTGD